MKLLLPKAPTHMLHLHLVDGCVCVCVCVCVCACMRACVCVCGCVSSEEAWERLNKLVLTGEGSVCGH